MVTGGVPRAGRRADCWGAAATAAAAASPTTTTSAVRRMFVTRCIPSMAEVEDDSAACAEVVDEAGIRLRDVVVRDRVHVGQPDPEPRLLNDVRDLGPHAETRR